VNEKDESLEELINEIKELRRDVNKPKSVAQYLNSRIKDS